MLKYLLKSISCATKPQSALARSFKSSQGFTLPDAHWKSFYVDLNKFQYVDGVYVATLNRDVASGFQLYTHTTCNQHATSVVTGQETLTTRTDFVNTIYDSDHKLQFYWYW